MKIAILGARGFLGSYLTNYFTAKGYTVFPVTRQTVNLESYYDVDYWLSKNDPDVIVNCAISGGGLRVNDINYSDVQRDLNIFLNFYNNPRVKKYINIGSGAEFDRRNPIVNELEESILFSQPLESYGFAKNTIARMCLVNDRFYTLRLFGCFDPSEPSTRLFKRYLADLKIEIEDKFFDYISASDFAKIVEVYCRSRNLPKDINCVYRDKYQLSSILMMLKPGTPPNVTAQLGKAYTGAGYKLSGLGISLDGIEKGLREYE